ncbi:MAG: chromosome segregation protein SMC [Atopobiaceae bacterium]|jgi:chromosome segregation protein
MYLKSLMLRGFKSFADKVEMTFDPGLNVIVGPNGSGKSNISDAVLWVLGEQSAKVLRGQTMEDVIFSGSSARPAVGLAEVTLVLDNADHTLPIDFLDVAITRRMYRSGESEYLINGSPSRLRDIQDVLHDSGLGKDTHSIISQGKLDSILSGRPEERRELIEEAAGISKHRRRKERAERKLDAMNVNLVRAKDVQREIARRLRPLERQVDQVRRRRELTNKVQNLQTILAVDDLRRLQARYRTLSSQDKEALASAELVRYQLEERQGDLNRYQSLLEQKGIFVGDLDEQRRRMQDALGRMESDMRLLEEKGKNMVDRLSEMRMRLSTMDKQRADSAQEHDSVANELAATRAAVETLKKSVSDYAREADQATKRRQHIGAEVGSFSSLLHELQRKADQETLAYAKLCDQIDAATKADEMYAERLRRIGEQSDELSSALVRRTTRKQEMEKKLTEAHEKAKAAGEQINTCRARVNTARKAADTKRKDLASAEADLSALEALDRASENHSGLVAALVDGSVASRVLCRVADLIEVPPTLEAAVESLLGDDLAALVVDDDQDALALAKEAQACKAKGTATFVVRRADVELSQPDGLPGTALLAQAHVLPANKDALIALLGKVRVISELGEALEARKRHPELSYVCLDGAIVRSDGRIRVGEADSSERGALERKRKLREAKRHVPIFQQASVEAAKSLAAAEEALSGARDLSAHAKEEEAQLAGGLSSLTSELGRLSAQRDSFDSERDQVERSRAAEAARVEGARQEVNRHKDAAEAATKQVGGLTRRLEKLTSKRSQALQEEREIEKRLSNAKLHLATVVERENHLSSREKELSRAVKDLKDRIFATQEAAASLDVVRLRVEPLHERYESIHSSALSWASRLKDRASLEEANSDSLKQTISEAKKAVEEASSRLDRAKESAAATKVELGKIEVEVKHAVDAITGYGKSVEEALELPELENREETQRKVGSLEAQIDGLGPVNEVAMDEYTKLKSRADYIGSQVDDLERAKAALRKITAAIDRKMRKQFITTFEAVNKNFSEMFSLLFPGGKACLELTDPEHLEESGVEISAQPRGKKLAKMMLMSGGERSLTALALLFAVYKTRTVPFYIFDEVEAALDDANLTKLLDAIDQLKKSTQLLVISHQRRTMEQADVLYGVSMRADGVSQVVSQRLDRITGKVVAA